MNNAPFIALPHLLPAPGKKSEGKATIRFPRTHIVHDTGDIRDHFVSSMPAAPGRKRTTGKEPETELRTFVACKSLLSFARSTSPGGLEKAPTGGGFFSYGREMLPLY
ncbi:hypothetical protein ZHAS_00010988 [Anopheles sinensis]|uniref:Uncharacterized protein n=1 Tax=Anopheles sinensis TaxID=74873 RepID=A0A084VYY7_ANOSI|nr:hypothetical protein ZHAS_00010988 [Anopheles sinensis]